jgi:hypothetical protein
VASVFAVVSKKVYETQARQAGKVLGLGQVWSTDKYASTHAALKPLQEGGHIFLVTVRPPDEALWLVAVLQDVKFVKDGWASAASTVAITDITSLKSKIKFANGAGITAAKGKLGMSLQTPRALSDADVALLLGIAGKPGATVTASAPAAAAAAGPQKIYHLNRHEDARQTKRLPCLCKKCIDKAGERVEVEGEAFVRRSATKKGRILHYWMPEALIPTEKQVQMAVEQRMALQLKDSPDPNKKKPKKKSDDDEDDE